MANRSDYVADPFAMPLRVIGHRVLPASAKSAEVSGEAIGGKSTARHKAHDFARAATEHVLKQATPDLRGHCERLNIEPPKRCP